MPNTAKKTADFQELPMPVRSFAAGGMARYRIYTSAKECKEVEAETVVDAIRASGVEAPFRVEREIRGREVLVESKKFLQPPVATPGAAEAAPTTPTASAEAAPAAPAEAAPAAPAQ